MSKPIILFAPVNPMCDYTAPMKHYDGDAGWDLCCSQECTIYPDRSAVIHTNIKIALPPGYWALLTGRSSTFRKLNLITNQGVIDNGWRGELVAVVYNFGSTPVCLDPGDRIIQLIPFALTDIQCEEAEDLPPGERDENGFGSTGTTARDAGRPDKKPDPTYESEMNEIYETMKRVMDKWEKWK